MERMQFETQSGVAGYVDELGKLFPNCITEKKDADGNIVKSVNFDMLKQLLSEEETDSSESYEFTWPGKKKAIAEANRAIKMTLRADREKSIHWEETKNLYIEGDNVFVLKLLQEKYFEKIKMIYIDPPYNTGSEFVYHDNFMHSEWCSMIYPRLMLARNLLSEDGAIFISIDDNEQANLKKMCDEIFGESNCVGEIIRKTKSMTGDHGSGFNLQHESLFIYAKTIEKLTLKGEPKAFSNYSNPDNDPNGDWCSGDPSARSGGPSTYFEIENPYTHKKDVPPSGRYWAFSQETLEKYIREGKVKFKRQHKDEERGFIFKRYKKDAISLYNPVHSLFGAENAYMNQAATIELKNIFGSDVFSYPKPVAFIKKLVQYATDEDSIVMDFFAGSATTAQAVIEQNAEDGGRRTFIMVQTPEEIGKRSGAYRSGFRTLCDIGRERIRLAAENLGDDIDSGYQTWVLEDADS
ncbi:MAG: site-specific DNA-methyltransferase [Lachnospiraceae bacterium]|nr:site-specific DNA-methyltransferase [Lachnospiraceae bacterium]